jgi:uncharacterized membrane protein
MNTINEVLIQDKNNPLKDNREISSLKKLRSIVTITVILGFLSVISLVLLYLALCDIAHGEEDLKLEWHVAGVSMIILFISTASTFVTLGLLMRMKGFWKQ